MKNKKVLIALAAVLVALFSVGVYSYYNDDNDNDQNVTSNQNQDSSEEQLPPSESSQETNNERPQPEEPAKTPVATISEEPLVYTGFGHSADKPLPSGQTTSTSCTTEPQIECVASFKNADNGKIVEFDAQTTNPEGVTVWSWTGGEEVPSGTWKVTVSAGNKTSSPETIYVQ